MAENPQDKPGAQPAQPQVQPGQPGGPRGQQQQPPGGDAAKAEATAATGGRKAARTASAFGDAHKAEAVRRSYPDRPGITAERETIDAIVFKDKQGREISVERFSPGNFAHLDEAEGGDEAEG